MVANDTQIAVINPTANDLMAGLEKMLVAGDLSVFSPEERLRFVHANCVYHGLNPLSRPFDYIQTDAGLKLYPNKGCAEQLRARHGVTVQIVSRETQDGVCVVTARATMPDGRTDEAIGAVALVKEGGKWQVSQNGKRYFASDGTMKELGPEARALAIMKAETKAKRRVTFSIVGLGMPDAPDDDGSATRWDFDPPTPLPPTPPAPPQQPPPAPESTGDPQLDRELSKFATATREQRLAMFASAKAGLASLLGETEGLESYYGILKNVGREHAWQLQSMGEAKRAYTEMWQILRTGVPVEEEPVQ